MSKWTRFMDMHSGGGRKLEWEYIYIEAPRDEAEIVFQNRFGRNPNRVTCTCCGNDYSISEEEGLDQATAFERGCEYENDKYQEKPATKYSLGSNYMSLQEYIDTGKAKFIYASDITPSERTGELHEEGYVWQ